jgi:metallo-beta-lactamase family protein
MTQPITVAFHGAAGTVTGSKHLLAFDRTRVLLDAGLFQGRKELRLLNWSGPRFDPRAVDRVLVSHSHLDHVGFLPRLVKLGMRAPVHLTPATHELTEILLLDSAGIQEEDAAHANRKGYTRHRPALPLYGVADVRRALPLRERQRFNCWLPLDRGGRARARFINTGHILGSAFIEIRMDLGRREIGVVYSGDIGRYDMPLHVDPRPLSPCDILIVEATYGDRPHHGNPLEEQLLAEVGPTLDRRGTVLVPSFAVGRSQQVTLVLRRLMQDGRIPDVPIHIDSPMAIDATRVYSRFLDPRNLDRDVFEDGRLRLFPRNVLFHRTVAESKELNSLGGPRIIVSASGMLTAGRVLHHLNRLAPDPRNLILLVGHQAPGTRGRALLDGAESVKMHGQHVPVRARVCSIEGLSGHAGQDELLRWIEGARRPPRVAFVVHSEPEPAQSFARLLGSRFGIRTIIPDLGDEHDLTTLLD